MDKRSDRPTRTRPWMPACTTRGHVGGGRTPPLTARGAEPAAESRGRVAWDALPLRPASIATRVLTSTYWPRGPRRPPWSFHAPGTVRAADASEKRAASVDRHQPAAGRRLCLNARRPAQLFVRSLRQVITISRPLRGTAHGAAPRARSRLKPKQPQNRCCAPARLRRAHSPHNTKRPKPPWPNAPSPPQHKADRPPGRKPLP